MTFSRGPNISRYFIICSVLTDRLDANRSLEVLRHELVWRGLNIGESFHATTDKEEVRQAVFALLARLDFSIQATVCEKSKAQPQVRSSKARFYKYPLFYHFKHGISQRLARADRLLVTAASIGTRKERETYVSNLNDVMFQTLMPSSWAVDFRPSKTCYGLQIADYCAWAIQRKWERGNTAHYDLISDKINYEYELWHRGQTHYY